MTSVWAWLADSYGQQLKLKHTKTRQQTQRNTTSPSYNTEEETQTGQKMKAVVTSGRGQKQKKVDMTSEVTTQLVRTKLSVNTVLDRTDAL